MKSIVWSCGLFEVIDLEFDLAIFRRQHDHLLDRPRPSEQEAGALLAHDGAEAVDEGPALGRHLADVRQRPAERRQADSEKQESERELGGLRPGAGGLGAFLGVWRLIQRLPSLLRSSGSR